MILSPLLVRLLQEEATQQQPRERAAQQERISLRKKRHYKKKKEEKVGLGVSVERHPKCSNPMGQSEKAMQRRTKSICLGFSPVAKTRRRYRWSRKKKPPPLLQPVNLMINDVLPRSGNDAASQPSVPFPHPPTYTRESLTY